MKPEVREAEQRHVLHRLLRHATIRREAAAEVDRLICEAVSLGVPQTQVANVAGTSQAAVSRLVSRARTHRSGRRRRSRPTAGAGGGTV